MCPVLFSIGKFTVYGYGTMIALGLIACFLLAMYRAKKYNIDPDYMFNGGLIGVIFGLIGAKITYWIVNLKSVIADPSMLLDLGGGFVVYGGLILGVIAACFYFKLKKTTILDKLDLAMPSISLGQALGRIGCFMAGCCYGKAAPDGAWYAVTFPAESLAPAGVPLIPIQLISALLDLLLCFILIYMTKKQRYRGSIVAAFMVFYSIGRFYVEFYRDEPRGNVWIFSTSQFIGIFVVLAGLALFYVFAKLDMAPLRVLKEKKAGDAEALPEEAAEEETEEISDDAEAQEILAEAKEELAEAEATVAEAAEIAEAAVEEKEESAEEVKETEEAPGTEE